MLAEVAEVADCDAAMSGVLLRKNIAVAAFCDKPPGELLLIWPIPLILN